VYKHEKEAKQKNMSEIQRLVHHKEHSTPVMGEIKTWMQTQIDEHLTEPNSGLGKAIAYLQNHWEKLTRFLSVAGAPLDNNVVERVLKLSIRCRKNSLFYKTLHGAAVGNILTSLIATCGLSKQNPVKYLTALQRYKSEVFKNPKDWLPWNYKATIEAMPPLVELKVV
jgi:transposase